ncbi:AfsA-related hotdog domain-containing protein [Blastococcus sp. SYSU DS0552]
MAPPGAGSPTWVPVEQALVHKTAPDEVLATELANLAGDRTAVAAHWPAAHGRYDRRAGTVGHLLLVVETIRQAGLCLAHRRLDVPLGEQFVFHRISTRLAAPLAELRGAAPAGTVTAVQPTVRLRAGRPSRASLRAEIWHGAQLWATADADYSWLPPAVYARLRALGRDRGAGGGTLVPRPRDAAEGDGRAHRSRVAVDLTDPTYFDHPVDHLPGMLLVGAALAAVTDRPDLPGAATRLAGLDLAFDRFAELDRPTWVRTDAGSGRSDGVPVQLGQDDDVVARGRVFLGG